MPTDSHGIVGCNVFFVIVFLVRTEISQVSVGTAKLFRKFQREKSAAKERIKASY